MGVELFFSVDGQTDISKLLVAFRYFQKGLSNGDDVDDDYDYDDDNDNMMTMMIMMMMIIIIIIIIKPRRF